MGMECYLVTVIGGDCIIAIDHIAINDLAAPPLRGMHITVVLDSKVANRTCFGQWNVRSAI